jgi:NAD(P)-dependent dehydrogenase (short-subunit alcohol dehydrogenase family)
MKIEIKHKGSCLGATGGSGRLVVRDALAKGHSVVVLVRSMARALVSFARRLTVRLAPLYAPHDNEPLSSLRFVPRVATSCDRMTISR